MIHFDTNFLIQAVVPQSMAHTKFVDWIKSGEICNVSTIAWAEFLCGPLDSPGEAIARHIFPNPDPFLSTDAAMASWLFNQTGRRSRSLADCMIASVAIRSGAKLATINSADFTPFVLHGLTLI